MMAHQMSVNAATPKLRENGVPGASPDAQAQWAKFAHLAGETGGLLDITEERVNDFHSAIVSLDGDGEFAQFFSILGSSDDSVLRRLKRYFERESIVLEAFNSFKRRSDEKDLLNVKRFLKLFIRAELRGPALLKALKETSVGRDINNMRKDKDDDIAILSTNLRKLWKDAMEVKKTTREAEKRKSAVGELGSPSKRIKVSEAQRQPIQTLRSTSQASATGSLFDKQLSKSRKTSTITATTRSGEGIKIIGGSSPKGRVTLSGVQGVVHQSRPISADEIKKRKKLQKLKESIQLEPSTSNGNSKTKKRVTWKPDSELLEVHIIPRYSEIINRNFAREAENNKLKLLTMKKILSPPPLVQLPGGVTHAVSQREYAVEEMNEGAFPDSPDEPTNANFDYDENLVPTIPLFKREVQQQNEQAQQSGVLSVDDFSAILLEVANQLGQNQTQNTGQQHMANQVPVYTPAPQSNGDLNYTPNVGFVAGEQQMFKDILNDPVVDSLLRKNANSAYLAAAPAPYTIGGNTSSIQTNPPPSISTNSYSHGNQWSAPQGHLRIANPISHRGRKKCLFFGTKRGCVNGDRCTFYHDPELVRNYVR